MTTPAKSPAESEATKLVRAKLQWREERLKHLEANYPTEANAIARVKKDISELKKQLPAESK